MPEKSMIETAMAYGPGMFFAIVLLIVCYKLITWVLKASAERENRLVQVIESTHERIGKNVKELANQQASTARAVESMTQAVRDFVCRAPK